MSQEWTETPAPMIRLPDLQGRRAVVTGASRGIGKAVVEALCLNGVQCFALTNEPLSLEVSPLIVPVVCDLSDDHAITEALAAISSQVSSLDYVVNVAGIDPKYRLEVGDAHIWETVVNVNLRAYYLLIRACSPLLYAGQGRSIVNVSSINYRLGVIGRSIYSSTKAGILGLTTGLARELGRDGIRINTITPGWVFTERQIEEYFSGDEAHKHLATLAERQSIMLKIQPADIANHVLFYLSQVSRASTGHNCIIDAGWLLE
jgi:NAD(P)-dependent dehydrogenase (short-subunit alcohol dehydrogenase family)